MKTYHTLDQLEKKKRRVYICVDHKERIHISHEIKRRKEDIKENKERYLIEG